MNTNAKLEVYNRCFLLKVSDKNLFGVDDPVEPDYKPDYLDIEFEYETNKETNKKSSVSSDIQDKDLTSVYRSKRSVQQIIKNNDWDYFVTFTFADRESDNQFLLNKALNRIKYLLKRHFISSYCLVPELQPKSGVLHFHGFICCDDDYMIYSDCVKVPGIEKPVKVSTYNKRYRNLPFIPVYNFKLWNLGFSVCYKVSNELDKLLVYMTKYILKSANDPVFDKEKPRRYFAGGDINRVVKSYNFYCDYLFDDQGALKDEFSDFKLYPSPFGLVGYLQVSFDNTELIDKLDKHFILKERLFT